MSKDVIIDIGVHNGEDTVSYLKNGYNVIGIEANPLKVALCRKRFSKFIENGNLELHNIGVGDRNGSLDFYINPKRTEWSSFNKDMAQRDYKEDSIITQRVKIIRLSDFLDELNIAGEVKYLKIDIESFDLIALESLLESEIRPSYISVELGGMESFQLLRALGYSRFKVINQSFFHLPMNLKHESSVIFQFLNLLLSVFRNFISKYIVFNYPIGSSGPFGENTKGVWLSTNEMEALLRSYYQLKRPFIVQSWFDLHGKL